MPASAQEFSTVNQMLLLHAQQAMHDYQIEDAKKTISQFDDLLRETEQQLKTISAQRKQFDEQRSRLQRFADNPSMDAKTAKKAIRKLKHRRRMKFWEYVSFFLVFAVMLIFLGVPVYFLVFMFNLRILQEGGRWHMLIFECTIYGVIWMVLSCLPVYIAGMLAQFVSNRMEDPLRSPLTKKEYTKLLAQVQPAAEIDLSALSELEEEIRECQKLEEKYERMSRDVRQKKQQAQELLKEDITTERRLYQIRVQLRELNETGIVSVKYQNFEGAYVLAGYMTEEKLSLSQALAKRDLDRKMAQAKENKREIVMKIQSNMKKKYGRTWK
jgi:hypothetical protein